MPTWMPPGRPKPGRPRRGEEPAPARKRTIAFPLDQDQALQARAQELGLSLQAAVRQAVEEWLHAHKGPTKGP